MSEGKSSVSIGCTGARARARGLGELGNGAAVAGFRTRLTDGARPVVEGDNVLVGFRGDEVKIAFKFVDDREF